MLRDEIKSYLDGNNMVCPNIPAPDQMRGSDNGLLFTSQYYILLKLRFESYENDSTWWAGVIEKCSVKPGLLSRAPNDPDQEGPDDYYGVICASKVLNRPDVAESIYRFGMKHVGVFNNENPGKFSWSALLWRQPQLLFATLVAANRWKWYKFYMWPLAFWTALVILTSCINVEKNRTDERILSWLLIKTVSEDSFLCRLASKVWYNRLYQDYGSAGMKEVANIYFQMGHPFVRYWVN